MPKTVLVTASNLDCACAPILIAIPNKHLCCRNVVAKTVEALGRIDILVNNASYQACLTVLPEVSIWSTEPGSLIGCLRLVVLSAPDEVKWDAHCPSMLQFSLLQVVLTQSYAHMQAGRGGRGLHTAVTQAPGAHIPGEYCRHDQPSTEGCGAHACWRLHHQCEALPLPS